MSADIQKGEIRLGDRVFQPVKMGFLEHLRTVAVDFFSGVMTDLTTRDERQAWEKMHTDHLRRFYGPEASDTFTELMQVAAKPPVLMTTELIALHHPESAELYRRQLIRNAQTALTNYAPLAPYHFTS